MSEPAIYPDPETTKTRFTTTIRGMTLALSFVACPWTHPLPVRFPVSVTSEEVS